jgi:hypothetical protein
MIYDPLVIRTQCEVIRSEAMLRAVIQETGLRRRWSARYAGGDTIPMPWMVEHLRSRIEISRIPETAVIRIRAVTEKPGESAELANALAQAYRDHRGDASMGSTTELVSFQGEILDSAVPARAPLPHLKLLNFSTYVLWGLALAFAAAGGAMRAVSRYARMGSKPTHEARSKA